jgi:predicted double-glycine peptidase
MDTNHGADRCDRANMPQLAVPFVHQISEHACGAAALEMVIRYYRPSKLTKFSQEKVFRSFAEHEPLGTGNYRITADNIVGSARNRGFNAGWGRVTPERDRLKNEITNLVVERRIPLIACQRYTDEFYTLGHFRVIIGVEEDAVIIHDPDPKTGGPNQEWAWSKILDYWKQTSLNVTGGVGIWITNDQTFQSPLAPHQPNSWDYHRWRPQPA